MRMFTPRKPHAPGVKLYVLANSTAPYVVDIYMYQGYTPYRSILCKLHIDKTLTKQLSMLGCQRSFQCMRCVMKNAQQFTMLLT